MKHWRIPKYVAFLTAVIFTGCTSPSDPVKESAATPANEPIIFPKKATQSIFSLQEAADRVVAYHPRITQALSEAKGEEEMINVAKANYYPQIKGGLGVGYDQNASGARSDNTKTVDFEIRQTLYDFGKTASSVKRAEYGHESAKVRSSITQEELIHTATTTLVEAVRQKKMIELSQQQVARVNSLVGLVDERHNKGASNLSDLLHAQSRLNDVKSEELDALAHYQTKLQTLKILLGAPSMLGVKLDALPKEFANSCAMPINWEAIPEYVMADLESKRARADLELARAEEKPTIYVTGHSAHPLNNTDRYRSRLDSKISLNVSMPVYQGGGLSAQKRASENYAHAAAARKEEVRLDIEQYMSDAAVRLNNMRARQSLLNDRVKNLSGTRDLYKKQYLDLGTRSLVDLLNSEQEFHRAQVDVENNRLDIIQTELNCAYYHGKLREFFNIAQP